MATTDCPACKRARSLVGHDCESDRCEWRRCTNPGCKAVWDFRRRVGLDRDGHRLRLVDPPAKQ